MPRFWLLLLSTACSSNTMTMTDAGGDTGVSPVMEAGTDAPSSSCNSALTMVLKPIDMVSTGVVTILSEASGVRTLYIDASAGGLQAADSNPRVYVDLSTGKRVDVTDVGARTSTAWDIAFKRYVIFSNGGTGGPGMGGTIAVPKFFDSVTAADATGTFALEQFVDMDCNQIMDPLGGFKTTMSDWYDYNQQTMFVTPKAKLTYVVRGGTGKLYKVGILQYYGLPDGGMGMAGGNFIVKVAPL